MKLLIEKRFNKKKNIRYPYNGGAVKNKTIPSFTLALTLQKITCQLNSQTHTKEQTTRK